MELETELRRVGNSAAVLIPKEVLKKEMLDINDKVRIIILPKSKKTLGQVLWGRHDFKESADKLKKMVKKELRWE